MRTNRHGGDGGTARSQAEHRGNMEGARLASPAAVASERQPGVGLAQGHQAVGDQDGATTNRVTGDADAIASILRHCSDRRSIAVALTQHFASIDDGFDRERFVRAVGI